MQIPASLRLGALACAAFLVACGGGGGGGGPSLSLSLDPASVTASFDEGSVYTFTVDATVGGSVDGVVNVVIIDSVGVIQPNVQIQQIGAIYQATIDTVSTLTAGRHQGNIVVKLCGDATAACTQQYASQSLHYDFTVVAIPAPTVTSLNPMQSVAGSAAFQLTVTGSGFYPSSTVAWNGSARPTTYVSATTLRAQIAAGDIANGGSYPVTVITPPPGGGTSLAVNHAVQNPAPTLTAVNPPATVAGCGQFTLTAAGTAFVPSSTIRWNGAPLATTFVSATLLTATVPATLISAAAANAVTVNSPAPGGGTTTARTVTVNADGPATSQAVALQISPDHAGVATVHCPDSLPAAPLWSVDVGGTSSYPLIAGGRVFVTFTRPDGDTRLVALDAATGAVAWGPVTVAAGNTHYMPPPSYASATYDSGRIFVASTGDPVLPVDPDSGNHPTDVQAYDAATGARLWETPFDVSYFADIEVPTAANGLVYTGGHFAVGAVVALNQVTGAIAWSSAASNGSPPAVTATGVYVTYPCTTIALSPTTGTQLWLENTGCSGGGGNTPVVAAGVVYSPIGGASALGGNAYDAATGELLGAFSQDRPSPFAGSIGYLLNDAIRATNIATGAVLWTFSPANGSLGTSPIVVGDLVISGSGQTLYAADAATGAQVWSADVGGVLPYGSQSGRMPQSGLAAGENVLVVPAGTRVLAYRVGTD